MLALPPCFLPPPAALKAVCGDVFKTKTLEKQGAHYPFSSIFPFARKRKGGDATVAAPYKLNSKAGEEGADVNEEAEKTEGEGDEE